MNMNDTVELDKEKLAEKYINLVYFVIKKHYPSFIGNDEIYQWGMYGLAKACVTYDTTKGVNFSTYAIKIIRRQIVRAIEYHVLPYNNVTSLDAEVNTINNDGDDFTLLDIINDDVDPLELKVDVESFYETLSLFEKKLVILYKLGYNQREIAIQLNCTHQWINRTFRKIRLKWRKFYNEK